MLEANLLSVDSLSSTNSFQFKHCINIGVHRHSFPAPVLSGKAILALPHKVKNSRVSSSSAQWLHIFLLAAGEKLIVKALLLDRFLRNLVSHNLQTQTLLFFGGGGGGGDWTSIHLPSSRFQSDTQTDRQLKAHGTSRRLHPIFVIKLQPCPQFTPAAPHNINQN